MAGKAFDAGKSLADLVLAKLPESLRTKMSEVFSAPEAADAITELGARGLAQSEFSKQMDEIRTREQELDDEVAKAQDLYQQNTAWWAKNEAAIKEYNEIKAKGGTPPKVESAPPGVSKEELASFMEERERAAANYLGLQNSLTLKHFQDFGEVIDTRELLQDRNLGKQKPDGSVYGLLDAYHTKFQTKITEKRDKDESARIDKLVNEKLTAERAKFATQPFPLRNAEPSVLDAFAEKPDVREARYTVDSAEAEYNRLQQVRGGA